MKSAIILFFFFFFFPVCLADVKLPYPKGERFVVVQGYNAPPTHIKKDAFAIDFSQNGCDAYGVPVTASAAGTVVVALQTGYGGGYGTELLVDEGDSIEARYAHMIPHSITVSAHERVAQGTILGKVGNTGLVAGMACPTHPGTHLHFAMYDKQADGTLLAHNPEPMSHFTDIQEGKWYLSDNGPPPAPSLSAAKTKIMEEALAQDLALIVSVFQKILASRPSPQVSPPSSTAASPFRGSVLIIPPPAVAIPPTIPPDHTLHAVY